MLRPTILDFIIMNRSRLYESPWWQPCRQSQLSTFSAVSCNDEVSFFLFKFIFYFLFFFANGLLLFKSDNNTLMLGWTLIWPVDGTNDKPNSVLNLQTTIEVSQCWINMAAAWKLLGTGMGFLQSSLPVCRQVNLL